MKQDSITLCTLLCGIKRHPAAVLIVIAASCAGGFLGVLACYNGWLG